MFNKIKSFIFDSYIAQLFIYICDWSCKRRLCFLDALIVFMASKTVWTESWETISTWDLTWVIIVGIVTIGLCCYPNKDESQSPMG
jgi:hypothetical protein